LERDWQDGAKVVWQILFYLLYRLKSATFWVDFNFGNKKSQQGPNLGIGQLGYDAHLILRQNFTDKE
jgi:hypothetical protein